MDFSFSYSKITLEECYRYEYYDLICDGDKKKIKAIEGGFYE